MTSVLDLHRPSDAVAGSFRDPSGYVFRRAGRVFRALDDACAGLLRELSAKGVLGRLQREGAIVRTRFVDDPGLIDALAEEHPGYRHFVEHEVLTALSWPYEWSISMLADAAALTVDLQTALLEAGCGLKDATAYNVQFDRGRPRFIDLSSVERPRRQDVWIALGQFQRMFVYPLLLCRHSGWDLRSYFLANVDGLDVRRVARLYGWLDKLRPRLLFDVTLPDLLGRWIEARGEAKREVLERPHGNPQAQRFLLRQLRSKVLRLAAGYKPGGLWAGYAAICNYEEQAREAKAGLVRRFLEATRPRLVMDLGCNTGDFSRLAVDCGAEVVAVDGDHDAVETLYRRLRQQPAPITPMVVDLCNPSPGVGLMNREREPFLGRFRPDCVLALALVHHLLVSGNAPLAAIRDMMHQITARDLVLEFVPPDDSMFRRLLNFRADLFGGLTLAKCREVFTQRFQLLREEEIAGSKRTLLFLRKT